MIINFDPSQPDSLSVARFCRSVKISRSVFCKIRGRARAESAAALHPRSRAPKRPARRYVPEVVNELVRIRKQLKADGWDYGPVRSTTKPRWPTRSPAGRCPRSRRSRGCWAGVGHVDAAPRKRPRSAYLPFARATAMALWQLDAFEYRLTGGQLVAGYQMLDDATRYDVGSHAYERNENSADERRVLEQAIDAHGAPKELFGA